MNFLTAPKPELGLRRLASAPLSKLPGRSPRRFPVRQRFRNGTNLRALPRKESELRCEADGSDRTSNRVLEKAASGFAAAAAAAAVMAVCGCDAPALAESLTVAFPVNTVQRTLVEAWGLIRETFIDPTFNHQGENLAGLDSEAAARKLRGRVGTTVRVKLHSGGAESGIGNGLREVQLPREVIKLSPISSTIISHISIDGHELKTGYVRLSAFSQNAAAEMENVILEMEDQGVQSYILDLRNNPGGLVKAGLDVAQMWLDDDETLVNTIEMWKGDANRYNQSRCKNVEVRCKPKHNPIPSQKHYSTYRYLKLKYITLSIAL
ncbi:TSPc [Musa troglodytarum]|uniref:TSPc n=1 Tax=Musa troglodytarum TaxID=320322 RepID=A0A9E7GA57_9LILI|nr:TSPc [Musa troglodytarum]